MTITLTGFQFCHISKLVLIWVRFKKILFLIFIMQSKIIKEVFRLKAAEQKAGELNVL